MSDLAPFVAAALRDKVIKELMEENQSIRKQLQRARRVEITGPGGTPVHAQAQFDDDGDYHGNPNLWSVKFPKGKQLLACPLSALEAIEIRVGGILKAQFAECDDFQTFLDPDDEDHEMGKMVSFCFNGPSSLWFSVRVDGWPENQWRETMGEQGRDYDALFRHLLDDVATETPLGKLVTFMEVAFMTEGCNGAIENLGPRTDAEDIAKAREQQAFLGIILERMRRNASWEDEPAPPGTLDQASSIQDAFYRLGVYDDGPMFEQMIDLLIESRQLSATDEDFENIVNNMVAISAGTYQENDGENEGEPMAEG